MAVVKPPCAGDWNRTVSSCTCAPLAEGTKVPTTKPVGCRRMSCSVADPGTANTQLRAQALGADASRVHRLSPGSSTRASPGTGRSSVTGDLGLSLPPAGSKSTCTRSGAGTSTSPVFQITISFTGVAFSGATQVKKISTSVTHVIRISRNPGETAVQASTIEHALPDK